MRRCKYQHLAAALTAGLLVIGQPAAAQGPWNWAPHRFNQADFDMLHPLIQEILINDAAGTSRPWTSPSGRHGRVHLDRGGDKAGSVTAVIRITRIVEGREKRFFTFHYRKDPKRGWAVAG